MFFDGRSRSKEGRRQGTINNSELTFIIYSSKALFFWHKSSGGVDGVDGVDFEEEEDASASPRRSSSFYSTKSAEKKQRWPTSSTLFFFPLHLSLSLPLSLKIISLIEFDLSGIAADPARSAVASRQFFIYFFGFKLLLSFERVGKCRNC